jgi:endonuclease YncB( thermonuclease family)
VNTRRASLPLKVLYAVVAAMLLWAIIGSVMAADLVGQVTVIDGDTLEMHGHRIRIWGIDAPESDQLCRGGDSLLYRCGARAANNLDVFIARRTVRCAPQGADRYGRTVASCDVAGIDIAGWLVGKGLALDWPRYSNGRYAVQQRQAGSAGVGIWSGSFVEPWQYRTCIRAGGNPTACSDDASRPRERAP